MPDYSKRIDALLDELQAQIHFTENSIPSVHAGPLTAESKDKFKQAIKALIAKEVKKAQLNMIEYYDQIPDNKSMNWKGLLDDNRKALQYELDELKKGV